MSMAYKLLAHRYWNSNGHAVAIVAIEGHDNDWAAYIGGSDFTQHEQDAVLDVARNGSKLSREMATLLFPQVTELTYRD